MVDALNKTADTLNLFSSNLKNFLKNTRGREKTDEEVGQIALKVVTGLCIVKTFFAVSALLGAVSLSPPALGLVIAKVAYLAIWGVLTHDMIHVDDNIQNTTLAHAVGNTAKITIKGMWETMKAPFTNKSTDQIAEDCAIEISKAVHFKGITKNTLVFDPLLHAVLKVITSCPQE